ncbi:MAG TPA: hypothetical protein PK718_02240 [Candidatus Methanofastidiosa archaeon]|nr:hypothetical protein [Candidatus Methanofastidiosa archaeon]HPR41350.1 hypothetical protein [Candidatus Methanofastidiosa archaeon]
MEVEGKEDYSLEMEGMQVNIRNGEKKSICPHIAIVLEQHGIVSIPVVDDVTIKKMIMEEKRGALPMKLPEDFYDLVRHSIDRTDDEKKRKLMMALAKDLLKERVEKIFKLCLKDKTPKAELLSSEMTLLLKLSMSIKEYEKDTIGV